MSSPTNQNASVTDTISQTSPKPATSPKRQMNVDLAKSASSPNVFSSRRSSSVPPGRRSMGRRASTTSLMGSGKNRLKDILAADANSIVELYEKSRVSVGASSGIGPGSRRSSIGAGRLSIGSNISGDVSEPGVGRSLDARRARKMAHEQAILLENRVARLQKLEEMYKKRIEQTTKQTSLIKQNKERHQKDLIEKYKLKLKEREKVQDLARLNARKAEERKRQVRDSRLKCLMEKRQRVQEEKRERESRKQQQREEEMNKVREKRQRIHSMGTSRQTLRVKRKESFSMQLQQKYLENTEHIAFEAQLRQKLNERSDLMCDKELEMIERLKKLEAEQQKAVRELKQVLS